LTAKSRKKTNRGGSLRGPKEGGSKKRSGSSCELKKRNGKPRRGREID
jgi:hypothetical protein